MKTTFFSRLAALVCLVLILVSIRHTSLAATAKSAAQAVTPNPDHSLLDEKTDPCDDYYQYACGGWLAKTEIPADRPTWDRSFSAIDEKNQFFLRDVLQDFSKGKLDKENPYSRQLGDYYASCMDESRLEKESVKTLKAELKKIDGLKKEDLPEVLAWNHLRGQRVFFAFGNSQDYKNPQEMIAEFHQGGMALPTKDYYFDDTEKMKAIRAAYLEHIEKMLVLGGVARKQAKLDAEAVLKIETKLATAALKPAELRDPTKLYHRMDQAALKELAPTLDWTRFFKAMGVEGTSPINVTIPDFMKTMSTVLQDASVADLKAYLKIRLIESASAALPERFVKQNFEFASKQFYGLKELPPRWKRCVSAVNGAMGFALSRSYVKMKFAGESKDIARKMIIDVEKQMGRIVDDVPWMDQATRTEAHAKLDKLVNHVGYPNKWRSYDGLKVVRKSYLANRFASNEFTMRYNLDKIGKPVDPNDWLMVPSMVNAYYDPQLDKMVFPAGILQPPFFHKDYANASNYGGIGMVMGHEISHGFDDEGRQYDSTGAMRDWWTEKASSEFNKRAQCLVGQYNEFKTPAGDAINGQLTLGENIGDQGGIKTSFYAWQATLSQADRENAETLSAEEKKFFLSFAQSWCGKQTDQFLQTMVKSNPHAPGRFRVIGALMNFPEFAKTYQCKEGAKMAPKNRCVVW
jgi:putative endopeptidase